MKAKKRAVVFGSSGMLGSAVASRLELNGIQVLRVSRGAQFKFDAETGSVSDVLDQIELSDSDTVVNCIGLTKSHIRDGSQESVLKAVSLNILFPNKLASEASIRGVNVIQVATDCVFSGRDGNYLEESDHDAIDVYGKTKSLGEVPGQNVMHVRCSLIGPEDRRNTLLYEWLRHQPQNAKINGFTNHRWNGVSSFVFGDVAAGIIKESLFVPGVQHLVPADEVTKKDLLELLRIHLGRQDLSIQGVPTTVAIDRTLATSNSELNGRLFAAAGFDSLPTIAEIIQRMPAPMADLDAG